VSGCVCMSVCESVSARVCLDVPASVSLCDVRMCVPVCLCMSVCAVRVRVVTLRCQTRRIDLFGANKRANFVFVSSFFLSLDAFEFERIHAKILFTQNHGTVKFKRSYDALSSSKEITIVALV
jgi:hypothetical protein